MALTLGRWIAAAVIGSLVLVTILIREPRERPRPRDEHWNLVQRYNRAGDMAGRAATRFRSAQVLDSVRTSLAAVRARPDSSRVIVSRGFGPGPQALIRSLVKRAEGLRSRSPAAAIDLVFVYDTITQARGLNISSGMRAVYLLPQPGGRCQALVFIRHPDSWANPETDSWTKGAFTGERYAARVIGPCALYEAFGQPGAGVDRWLRSGGWRFGAFAAINRKGESVYMWEPSWEVIPWGSSAGWPLRRYVSRGGYRCATGDAAACRAQLLEPVSYRMAEGDPVGSGIVRQPLYWGDYIYRYDLTLGGAEPGLLGDMARSLGPERFKRFWTSDQPPTEAFMAATGEDIGEWTARWAKDAYGDHGRGPGIGASGVVAGVVVTLLLLGAATLTTRRRQVA